jgi:hypothetical protein
MSDENELRCSAGTDDVTLARNYILKIRVQ